MLVVLFLITLIASEGSWLSTKGNKIVNSAGDVVRISGLNWFGFETNSYVFHGLWDVDFHKIVSDVSERGFNCFRVPVSADLLHSWKDGKPIDKININYYANPDLEGMNSQEVFDYFLEECRKYRLRVFIDVHGIEPDSYHDNLWFSAGKPPEYLFTALEYFADHYKNEDTVIGIDLKNEPHGYGGSDESLNAVWDDSKTDNNWKYAAETAAKRVLAKNPNLLILVEGIEFFEGKWGWWGGNLEGVAEHPIDLGQYQKQLVYAPHEYGPDLWDQWWFHVVYDNFSFESLYQHHWHFHWMFIWEEEIAPLLIGEWGGMLVNEDNIRWLNMMVELIGKYGLSQTFWCLNPNSSDTGGLLLDDWETWDEEKYALIKPILADKLL